jgi:hypothetical protein
MTPAEVLARPQNLAQIEQRNAEWLAETPGGPPWTERQRGEGFFQAGYDRYVLLAALQEAQERVARLEAVYGAAVAFVDSGVLVHRNFWPLTQALHAAVEAADRHFQPAEQERGHFDLDRQGKPFVRHELPPAALAQPAGEPPTGYDETDLRDINR